MSLLIKALDKAQEESQAAKGKQPKAKQSQSGHPPQANSNGVADGKRQPSPLIATSTGQNLASGNAASEKIATANALELELAPKIKADYAVKPAQYNPENSKANQAEHISIDTPKSVSTGTLNAVSTSRAAASSKVIDNATANKINAANVFAAKRIEANHQNSKIAFIVGVAAIVLTAIAAYFYQLAESDADLRFIAKRPAMPVVVEQTKTIPLPENAGSDNTDAQALTAKAESAVPQDLAEVSEANAQKLFKAESAINALRLAQNEKAFGHPETENQPVSLLKEAKLRESNVVDVERIASKSASIQVSKTTEPAGVDPVLMRAYQAYNSGNDAEAIKLYKQVLQRDVRNVDALLGLGAIAQRQGRLQDANGWYGKVLELDPKNSIALNFNLATAVDNQAPNDVNSESRIKNMLAKQPDDASLHATLGNFYADSNQWSAAQQAYFDAYRLNASADNAFNLAISLDQLGKPKVALPYYQHALVLSHSTRSNIDKAALEARIAAIQ